MIGIVLVTSERGYAATRVTDILKRTGISSRTFYAHFDNRATCFFAAYDAVAGDLNRLLDGAGTSASAGPEHALRLVLEYFSAWPAHARVLLVEGLSAGPAGVDRYEQTMAELAERLAACTSWQPGACDSLERPELAQAVIGAMVRMIQLRVISGEPTSLPHLLPVLTALTTRVGIEAPAARR